MKRRLVDLAVVMAITLFMVLALNFVLAKFSPFFLQQSLFPRKWLNNVDRCYHTFYPSTHDGNLEHNIAVVGDSYGAGSGDEFLDGASNYGIFHKLKARTGDRYLIFARGGFGSINSASEIIYCMTTMNNSLLLPRIGTPKKILVLFYEGNDLNNNVGHLSLKGEGQTIDNFVKKQILHPRDAERLKHLYTPLLDLFPSPDPTTTFNYLKAGFTSLYKKRSPADSRYSDAPLKNTGNHINRVVVAGTVHEVPEKLQSAGTELTENFDDAMQVFQSSVLTLQSYFHDVPIEIVYLPSVLTCYRWDGQVQIQAHHT